MKKIILIYVLALSIGYSQTPVVVKPLSPTDSLIQVFDMKGLGDQLLFLGEDNGNSRSQLWVYNSSINQPKRLTNLSQGFMNFITVAGKYAYLVASVSPEIWRTDGTQAGTFALTKITNQGNFINPHSFTASNGFTYFIAEDDINGQQIWRTDGTDEGTIMIKKMEYRDLNSPRYLTDVNGTLFFVVQANLNGKPELWKTNGIASGTVLVKEFEQSDFDKGPISNLVNFKNELFFVADDGKGLGVELWKTDGTPKGTTLVKDTNFGVNGGYFNFMTVSGNTLYFNNLSGLWKTDGTTDGTFKISELSISTTNEGGNPLVDVNGVLFLAAFDYLGIYKEGVWKIDPITFEKTLIKTTDYNTRRLININGKLYFDSQDKTYGMELWQTDGSASGTTLVSDISKGSNSSLPQLLTNVNGTLYFVATTVNEGSYLWNIWNIWKLSNCSGNQPCIPVSIQKTKLVKP